MQCELYPEMLTSKPLFPLGMHFLFLPSMIQQTFEIRSRLFDNTNSVRKTFILKFNFSCRNFVEPNIILKDFYYIRIV